MGHPQILVGMQAILFSLKNEREGVGLDTHHQEVDCFQGILKGQEVIVWLQGGLDLNDGVCRKQDIFRL